MACYLNLTGPITIPIPGGALQEGSQFTVHGTVSNTEPRFHFNFQAGEEGGCDIGFHFSSRIDQQVVVRNSFQGGWKNEERGAPNFPFKNGCAFTVHVVCTAKAFEVYVNNCYFTTFNHRLPFADIKFVRFTDGATYHKVVFKQPCRAPYQREIGELIDGAVVRVRGSVNDDASRFGINFMCDESGSTIGFHFNPRQDETDTVCNSKTNGHWGAEERGFSDFPFTPSQFFDIFFQIHDGAFIVSVNGKHLHSFKFRVPLSDIKFLQIYGDIALMDVNICNELINEKVIPIPGGLHTDDMVVIEGFFRPDAHRFRVDLTEGLSADADILFHFSPRRDQNVLVLNSRKGGWQKEVRYSLDSMDPNSTKDLVNFQLCFVNKETKFDIYYNGKFVGDFLSRGNMADIKGIICTNDAYFHSAKVLPKLENPHVFKLPVVQANGDWYSVQGIPNENSVRFVVEFKTGENPQPSAADDIAFHYNPRFNSAYTARNTLHNGVWGKEDDNDANFPYGANRVFEVNTLMTAECYKVYVNGTHHINYKHRLGTDNISHVVTRLDADFYNEALY